MSEIISVGVVGRSYWSYMAIVIAKCLERIIDVKRIEYRDIPQGVYKDARQFFGLVLQAAGDTVAENPPASLNAYVIAMDTATSVAQPILATRLKFREFLERLSSFLDQLEEPHQLTREELETADILRKFFLQLHHDGEKEAYETTVSFEVPIARSRLL